MSSEPNQQPKKPKIPESFDTILYQAEGPIVIDRVTIAGPSGDFKLPPTQKEDDGSFEAGVKLSAARAEADIALTDSIAAKAALNLNVNTGVRVADDTVGVSVLGFGFSAGKETAIKTPFGSLGLAFGRRRASGETNAKQDRPN